MRRFITTEKDGYRFIWTARRDGIDCDVYHGDDLITELSYPKLRATSLMEIAGYFQAEALIIANEKRHSTRGGDA